MTIKCFICADIPPTASKKLLKLKEGLKLDFKGAWISRESIDMISAIEGYDVWNGFVWKEVSCNLSEHEFETALKHLKERPM